MCLKLYNVVSQVWGPYFRVCTILESLHYSDVTMGAIASQITSLTIVCSTVYSDADLRKQQSSASPVNSPHKGQRRGALRFFWSAYEKYCWVNNRPVARPVTRKMFPFDDVIMSYDTAKLWKLQQIISVITLQRCSRMMWTESHVWAS